MNGDDLEYVSMTLCHRCHCHRCYYSPLLFHIDVEHFTTNETLWKCSSYSCVRAYIQIERADRHKSVSSRRALNRYVVQPVFK